MNVIDWVFQRPPNYAFERAGSLLTQALDAIL
jgi:hypothetical protein